MSDPTYLHELRGQYPGLAVGRQEGFASGQEHGYNNGWNDAMREVTPRFEALQRENAALQQERDALKRDRLDLQYAANAFSVISRTMQAIIESAPASMQVDAIHRYNELCDRYLNNGVLRTEPHNDPTAKERDSEVTGFFPKLTQRLNARSTPDDDYSP